MLFGDSTPEFIRYVLGIEQQQTISMLTGFTYHTLFLDAFSGKTQTLDVLNDIVYAFGLIGFTMLALQRSLWTASVIISWIALIGLMLLGARSDVLFTPLDQDRARLVAALESPFFGEVVTGLDNATDSVRRWGKVVFPGSFSTEGSEARAEFPKLSDMLKGVISSQKEQVEKIGAFTPMVFTLYTFNRLKFQLIDGLKGDIDVDILSRTGLAQKMAAGRLSPSTAQLLNTFNMLCLRDEQVSRAMFANDQIFNAPDSVARFPLPNGKKLQDQLTEQTFTAGSLIDLQKKYFDNTLTTPETRNTFGLPVPVLRTDDDSYINTDARTVPPSLMQSVSGGTAWGTRAADDIAEELWLEHRNSIAEGEETDGYRTMRDNVNKASLQEINDISQIRSDLFLTYMLPGKEGIYDDSAWSSNITEKTVKNCWDLYVAFSEALKQNFEPSELELKMGRLANEQAANSGTFDEQGNLVYKINPDASDDQYIADQALVALGKQAQEICDAEGQSSDECKNAKFELETGKKIAKENAVGVVVGSWIEKDKDLRDPSKQFTSSIRNISAKAGELLGPVAVWFFALFGGFAAGAYSAIIPSFMNFALMMIFAITPFMFMMGVLMPGWAPQIILTPIVVVAYIKIVEIMFVIVGFVFAALRTGLESAGLINKQGWFSSLFSGPDVFNSMYDIMVGMAYTSMFALAGFMIAGIRSPEKIVGAIASAGDKAGRIDASEVLKIGAAVKGGIATVKGGYNNVRNVGKAAVKSADMISKGEIPVFGGPTFVSEALLESRAEIAKRATTRATLMEDGESFLARTQANAVDAADENRVKGEAALMRKKAGGGTISHESDGSITIKAQAANIKSEKADVDAKIANAKAIGGWQGVGQYRTSKEIEADNKSWDEDVVELVQILRANERQDLIANTTPGQQSELKQLEAYAKYFSTSDKAVKDVAKRLGFGNDVKDTFIRDNGIEYEGSGAFDVTKSFIRDVIKNANPNLSNDRYDSMANIEMLKILMANKFNRGGIITRSAPASVDTNFQPGDPNRITETTVTVNAQAPGMADFMARYAASVQNVVGGRLVGNDLNLSSSVRPKGTIRTP